MKIFALFTEDGLDQICYEAADAKREAKDLRGMGCSVKTYTIEGARGEEAADAMNETFCCTMSLGKAARAEIAAMFEVTIK